MKSYFHASSIVLEQFALSVHDWNNLPCPFMIASNTEHCITAAHGVPHRLIRVNGPIIRFLRPLRTFGYAYVEALRLICLGYYRVFTGMSVIVVPHAMVACAACAVSSCLVRVRCREFIVFSDIMVPHAMVACSATLYLVCVAGSS